MVDGFFTIIRGSISRDRVHLFLSVPPFLPVSELVQLLRR
jgi:hypothetical protein